MLRKLLIALVLCAPVYAQQSIAGEVVKWVDEDGVTHFGNAQFAPAGGGEAVKIERANGMAVPKLGILNKQEKRTRMNVTVLERSDLENPRGWRGHHSRARTRSGAARRSR